MDYKKIFTQKGLEDIDSFLSFMQNEIEYGWIDQQGGKHYGVNDGQSYRLQAPEELLESHLGICWDVTELCRCFFENMTSFKFETYYLFYEDNGGCPSHSILVFYEGDKVYWFEPMFNGEDCFYSGIHEYDNIRDLLDDFKRMFIKNALIKKFIPVDYEPNNFMVYMYGAPPSHINGYSMRNHIDNSVLIDI